MFTDEKKIYADVALRFNQLHSKIKSLMTNDGPLLTNMTTERSQFIKQWL